MTTKRFFVIGSWSEGQFHFSKIKNSIVSVIPAAIKARVFRMPTGFPVLVEGGLQSVEGEVVELAVTDTISAFLDEMHGFSAIEPDKGVCSKVSTVAEALDEDGLKALNVDVYFVKPQHLPEKAMEIHDGQWKLSMMQAPPLVATLSERQRTFIKKLSQLTGREVLPIDLQLYRELMKLELIIDKGRRLALSKLGKEVVQYIG